MKPNALIHETSPYLLQHAHNPVRWQPWGDAAWQQARQENKLVLVSIGYSACHWCHVMERESFEDEALASLLNAHFVAIKVDREERPDVDQVYMDAVQLMRQGGGWPLNCFTLPDARPIYGGTYFTKDQFTHVLQSLQQLWATDPARATGYAENLTDAIQEVDQRSAPTEVAPFTTDDLVKMYIPWSQQLDLHYGGTRQVPKFPVPCNWQFQLAYAHHSGNLEAMRALELTLARMAYGGIYDQLGGGFARYSTDAEWLVPHFEKMLYDNAQLVTLYSEAYRKTKNPLYEKVIQQTLGFITRELMGPEGNYYAALDADSEGVEGKFYVWQLAEVQQLLGPGTNLAQAVWNLTEAGNWEHGNNILHQTRTHQDLAALLGISPEQFAAELDRVSSTLLAARQQRPRPGLDDKTITAWNALQCRAWVDAYLALGQPEYLAAAQALDSFMESKLAQGQQLFRSYKAGRATHAAYLDDYAHQLLALIALYQATFELSYLQRAEARLAYVEEAFWDAASGYYYYTSNSASPLIARKKEFYDSVMPSSNAAMAHVLLSLGKLLDKPALLERAQRMVAGLHGPLQQSVSGFASWALAAVRLTFPEAEVAIVGPAAEGLRKELAAHYLPQALLLGSSTSDNPLPLLQGKYVPGQTLIYVCRNKTCRRPVSTVAEALAELGESY